MIDKLCLLTSLQVETMSSSLFEFEIDVKFRKLGDLGVVVFLRIYWLDPKADCSTKDASEEEGAVETSAELGGAS